MAKRGPKPQPTVLKLARGNPGKRKLNSREPQPKGKLPECPAYLDGKAREAWLAFAEQLTECGIARRLDATALEMLCTSYGLYADAMQKVIEFGPVWMEKGDSKIPKFCYSPHWAIKNREWKNVLTILREFGMTPSSRSAVNADEASDAASPMAQFLKGA